MRRVALIIAVLLVLALPAAASARVRLISITSAISAGSYATEIARPARAGGGIFGRVGAE